MNREELLPPSTSHDTSRHRLLRHFVEMLAAMVAGMMVLGAVVRLIFALLGYSDLLGQTEVRALVMATNMTVGMSLWMRHRGHTWASVGEMAGAMFIPFIILMFPFRAGMLSGDAVMLNTS